MYKKFSLNNKIIVITGALGLLGKKHVEAVAQNGGVPIILDVKKKHLKKYAEYIKNRYKVSAMGIKADVTKEKEIILACKKIVKKFGNIDGLVNNAANNPKIESSKNKSFCRLENFPLNIWKKDIDVGLTGALLCSKHFGFQIAKNKNGGSIINISSDLGLIGPDQRIYYKKGLAKNKNTVKPVTYSVVKSGIIGLTRYLATYWADKKVRCNAICPGGVENNQSKYFINLVSKRIPMGRLAKSDEYQGTLLWMLSDASSYLNGAIVPVDGGRTVW